VKEHEAVRALLALGAAGALDPQEERRVREHVAVCESCAGGLRSWQALTGELAALPVPQAPPALVSRTRSRVAAALEAEAGRRWDEAVLFWLALLAWTVALSSWAAWVAVLGFTGTLTYLTVSTMLVWLTAGVAAVIAHSGGKYEPL
jgi:anti-sigma factor RsiW